MADTEALTPAKAVEAGVGSPETHTGTAAAAAPETKGLAVATSTEETSEPAAVTTAAPLTSEKATIETPATSVVAPTAIGEKTTKADAAVTETATTPLQQLWATAKANAHPEIWGVTLADPDTHVPSQIVFQKYLNANDGDTTKAKEQLTKTLDWRAKTKPLESLSRQFSKEKFGGLGYVTVYGGDVPETKEVFTWNIYGIVKSMDATFGDVDE